MSDFDSRARKAADAVRQQIADNTSNPEKGIRRAQRSPGRVAIPSAVAAAVLIAVVAVALPRGGDGGGHIACRKRALCHDGGVAALRHVRQRSPVLQGPGS